MVFAVLMATKIVSPNLWGWLADHTKRHVYVIRLAALLSCVFFVVILFWQSYPVMLLVMAAFSFFWNASLPQFEAVTFHHLRETNAHYSQVRLWGSIGFIITVLAVGQYLRQGEGIQYLPEIMLACLVGLWGMTLVCPEKTLWHEEGQVPLLTVIRKPRVLLLLLVCLLIQASHGPYYTFFSLYLEDYGYGSTAIGWIWAISVASEVVAFLYVRRLFNRFSLERLLLCAVLLTTVRWLLIAYGVTLQPVLILAQLLHAISFALFHAVAIQMIAEMFPQHLQGRGQGLYSSVSFGMGGAIGAFYAGQTWDGLGGQNVYLIAAGLSLLAGVLMLWLQPVRTKQ